MNLYFTYRPRRRLGAPFLGYCAWAPRSELFLQLGYLSLTVGHFGVPLTEKLLVPFFLAHASAPRPICSYQVRGIPPRNCLWFSSILRLTTWILQCTVLFLLTFSKVNLSSLYSLSLSPVKCSKGNMEENKLLEPHNHRHPLFYKCCRRKLTQPRVQYILNTYADMTRNVDPELVPGRVSRHW